MAAPAALNGSELSPPSRIRVGTVTPANRSGLKVYSRLLRSSRGIVGATSSRARQDGIARMASTCSAVSPATPRMKRWTISSRSP